MKTYRLTYEYRGKILKLLVIKGDTSLAYIKEHNYVVLKQNPIKFSISEYVNADSLTKAFLERLKKYLLSFQKDVDDSFIMDSIDVPVLLITSMNGTKCALSNVEELPY